MVIIILLFTSLVGVVASARTAEHASVIMYHRFGESRYPSTNTTLEQFEVHLAELASGNYNIMSLADITEAIVEGRPLPDYTVAITVDDAFISFYKEAFPLLKSYGLPVTLFVATEAIDLNRRGYASWDQIREMQAAGVEIGSQSHTHPHMPKIDLAKARLEIETSNNRFIDELGVKPKLFAYPFGEYTPEIRNLIKEMGFDAAFGQHSGVMHETVHSYEFPRFAFNEFYGDLDRLRLATRALPIPATDIIPESMVLVDNPPLYGFTVTEEIGPLNQITCFESSMGTVETTVIGSRVEVRLPEPITGTRGRINCTMPYLENGNKSERWRWLGRQLIP
jgi:peptidoglycan/xylan/chitin deacetylase (PgdA/CDA1 family)